MCIRKRISVDLLRNQHIAYGRWAAFQSPQPSEPKALAFRDTSNNTNSQRLPDDASAQITLGRLLFDETVSVGV